MQQCLYALALLGIMMMDPLHNVSYAIFVVLPVLMGLNVPHAIRLQATE